MTSQNYIEKLRSAEREVHIASASLSVTMLAIRLLDYVEKARQHPDYKAYLELPVYKETLKELQAEIAIFEAACRENDDAADTWREELRQEIAND